MTDPKEVSDVDALRETGDTELARSVGGGDDSAFRWLWERLQPGVTRAWVALTGDQDSRPDFAAVGDIVLEALSGAKPPSGHDLRLFVYTQLRKQLGISPGAGADAIRPGGDPVERIFVKLPGPVREVLWFCEVEHLDDATTAIHLGVDPDQVEFGYRDARRALSTAWLKSRLADEKQLGKCRAQITLLVKLASNGELAPADQVALADHVAECDRCAAIHADIELFRSTCPRLLAAMALGHEAADRWIAAEGQTPTTAVEEAPQPGSEPASVDESMVVEQSEPEPTETEGDGSAAQSPVATRPTQHRWPTVTVPVAPGPEPKSLAAGVRPGWPTVGAAPQVELSPRLAESEERSAVESAPQVAASTQSALAAKPPAVDVFAPEPIAAPVDTPTPVSAVEPVSVESAQADSVPVESAVVTEVAQDVPAAVADSMPTVDPHLTDLASPLTASNMPVVLAATTVDPNAPDPSGEPRISAPSWLTASPTVSASVATPEGAISAPSWLTAPASAAPIVPVVPAPVVSEPVVPTPAATVPVVEPTAPVATPGPDREPTPITTPSVAQVPEPVVVVPAPVSRPVVAPDPVVPAPIPAPVTPLAPADEPVPMPMAPAAVRTAVPAEVAPVAAQPVVPVVAQPVIPVAVPPVIPVPVVPQVIESGLQPVVPVTPTRTPARRGPRAVPSHEHSYEAAGLSAAFVQPVVPAPQPSLPVVIPAATPTLPQGAATTTPDLYAAPPAPVVEHREVTDLHPYLVFDADNPAQTPRAKDAAVALARVRVEDVLRRCVGEFDAIPGHGDAWLVRESDGDWGQKLADMRSLQWGPQLQIRSTVESDGDGTFTAVVRFVGAAGSPALIITGQDWDTQWWGGDATAIVQIGEVIIRNPYGLLGAPEPSTVELLDVSVSK